MGGLSCTICTHPKSQEINALLTDRKIRGEEVAKAYGLVTSTINRHRRKCLNIYIRKSKNYRKIPGSFGPASEPKIQPKRPLSQEERIKIREMLDIFFDEEKGIYKNNFSDQSIGEKLNIPWKHVFNMREIAYGPIREEKQKIVPEYITNLAKIIKELQVLLESIKKSL